MRTHIITLNMVLISNQIYYKQINRACQSFRREFYLFSLLQILLQHAAHRKRRPGTEKQQDHRHRIRRQKNPRQQGGCNAQRTRQGTLWKTKRKQPGSAPSRAFPFPLKRKEIDCRAAQDQPHCACPTHQGISPDTFRQQENRRSRSSASSPPNCSSTWR